MEKLNDPATEQQLTDKHKNELHSTYCLVITTAAFCFRAWPADVIVW
jgi:hypothetical protein